MQGLLRVASHARPLTARPLTARPLTARPLTARSLTTRPLTARPLRLARSGLGWRHQPIRTLITENYTDTHEMFVFDDDTGIGTLHITEHAEQLLGDIVYVETLTPGEVVTKGDPIGVVESVKAASDFYAPVSGTIIEVNRALEGKPDLVNKSSYDRGWLCKIKVSNPEELKDMLSEEGYKLYIDVELFRATS